MWLLENLKKRVTHIMFPLDSAALYFSSEFLPLGSEESLFSDNQIAYTPQNTSPVSLTWLKPDFSLRTVLPL